MSSNRLLSINNYHYRRGGADVQYLEHAAAFERLGWESGYFSMHHPKNLPSAWSRYFIDEIELGSDYTLAQKLGKGMQGIYNREAQRRLRTLLADFHPSLAQLHNIYHHLSPAILPVLKEARIPVVLTAHDMKIACPNYQMFSHGAICERCIDGNYLHAVAQRCAHGSAPLSAVVALEALLHNRMLQSYRRHVDRITVPSRFLLEKFVEWGWPRERFVHIPNFSNTSEQTPRYEAGRHFLYFGRLSKEKGLTGLVEAAARAGVPLRLAGTGPMEAELRALGTELGADLQFLGFRSGTDLHDEIRSARAVVLNAIWHENAPLSILEAFGFGKPVVASDAGGIPEMVRPGRSGWLVRARDVGHLSETLAQVSQLPDQEVSRIGRSARELAIEEFSATRYLKSFRALYQELLEEHRTQDCHDDGLAAV